MRLGPSFLKAFGVPWRLLFLLALIGLIPFCSDAFLNKEYLRAGSPQAFPHSENQPSPSSKLSAFFTSSPGTTSLQPFNPFTSRNRNNKVRWHNDNLDIIYHYIVNQPLLTMKQEFQLGRAIQFWNRLENVRESLKQSYGISNITISDEELATYIGCHTEEIHKMKRYYEVSKKKLLICNLRLVLAVVSRYRTSSVANSELIMQGTLGLSHAVVRYDYSKGFRFATYATWYIHQAVADYVRVRKSSIRLPNRHLVLLRRVKQYMTDVLTQSGRNPSIGEISEALQIPRYEVMRVLSRPLNPTRLDESVNKAGNSKDQESDKPKTYASILPSVHAQPTDKGAGESVKNYIEHVLSKSLTEAEKEVLRLRLGLNNGRETPLKEVGRKFKISWKQVQKLEEEALGKLQSLELDPEASIKILNQQEILHQAS
eukprot:gene11779-12851_t